MIHPDGTHGCEVCQKLIALRKHIAELNGAIVIINNGSLPGSGSLSTALESVRKALALTADMIREVHQAG